MLKIGTEGQPGPSKAEDTIASSVARIFLTIKTCFIPIIRTALLRMIEMGILPFFAFCATQNNRIMGV